MPNPVFRLPLRAAALALAALAALAPVAGAGETGELADLGLEQLLGLDVYAASRFPQPLAEAPSAITVVTAEDIRQYGYRTLGDVLRSIPGLHVSSDRVYDYLGVRGIRRAGDFNAPVLLLIDGRRQNDNVYEAAAIGHELPVPMELIDRVEFVRGPGSSIFGSNALFGTINVVTRKPASRAGVRAAVEVGTAGLRRGYLQFDTPLPGRTALQLSADLGRREGEDLRVDQDGSAVDYRDLDHEEYDHYTAKLLSGAWTLEAVHGERHKQSPLPIYGADAGSPDNRYHDSQGFVSLSYDSSLGEAWRLQGQLLHGHYRFRGDLAYEGVLNRDLAQGRWWGGDLSAVFSGFDHHQLLIGTDFQDDYRQRQTNYDLDPYLLYQDSRRRGARIGAFVQDDWRLGPRLSLNAGLRHDRYSDFSAVTTPRLALIGKPTLRQTLKLIYGEAYRVPSAFERYYAIEGYEPNPDLRPESSHNLDLIWEHRASETLRLQAAAQWLRIQDYILQDADSGQFINRDGHVTAQGLDLTVDKHWPAGIRSRGSFSLQRNRDRGGPQVDAPRWLAKLHGSLPVAGRVRLGTELLGVGGRHSAGGRVGDYWLLNLTASGLQLRPGLELALSVDNLLDERHTDPSSPDLVAAGIDAVPNEGRQLRLRLDAAF